MYHDILFKAVPLIMFSFFVAAMISVRVGLARSRRPVKPVAAKRAEPTLEGYEESRAEPVDRQAMIAEEIEETPAETALSVETEILRDNRRHGPPKPVGFPVLAEIGTLGGPKLFKFEGFKRPDGTPLTRFSNTDDPAFLKKRVKWVEYSVREVIGDPSLLRT